VNALADTRILLALDASDSADEGIALAVRLASSLQAAIHGLMVEDQALLDAAALPFTSIVARGGVPPPEFSVAAVERSLDQAEQNVRAAFSAVTHQLHLSWTVQRQRGDLLGSLSACAAASDIVVLPVDSLRAGSPTILSDLHKITEQVRGVVLTPRQQTFRHRRPGPVVAIDDQNQMGTGVVALASQLAAGMDCPLRVLRLAGSVLGNDDVLAARLAAVGPSLLVASMHTGLFTSESAMSRLQKAARAPVLFLRSADTH
jgi:nucleotide-binding universal stress UspA family protein